MARRRPGSPGAAGRRGERERAARGVDSPTYFGQRRPMEAAAMVVVAALWVWGGGLRWRTGFVGWRAAVEGYL